MQIQQVEQNKLAFLGYVDMLVSLVYSTLLIFGKIGFGAESTLIASLLIWIWGGDAIYLLYKNKSDLNGIVLAAGFIVFTILSMFLISVALFFVK